MAGNNGVENVPKENVEQATEENVEHVIVNIGLSLDGGIDPSKAAEYLEKLFKIGDRFGDLLHNEKLTVGEALFVIYMLEKGALSTMNIDEPSDMSHLLLEDNKTKIDIIANMIVKNNIEKGEEKREK